MRLMSIKDAYDMINDISYIYDLDVNITHGGTYLMKLKELKEIIDEIVIQNNIRERDYIYNCVTINGVPLLKDYELLDADTLNVHMPIGIFDLTTNNSLVSNIVS